MNNKKSINILSILSIVMSIFTIFLNISMKPISVRSIVVSLLVISVASWLIINNRKETKRIKR